MFHPQTSETQPFNPILEMFVKTIEIFAHNSKRKERNSPKFVDFS